MYFQRDLFSFGFRLVDRSVSQSIGRSVTSSSCWRWFLPVVVGFMMWRRRRGELRQCRLIERVVTGVSRVVSDATVSAGESTVLYVDGSVRTISASIAEEREMRQSIGGGTSQACSGTVSPRVLYSRRCSRSEGSNNRCDGIYHSPWMFFVQRSNMVLVFAGITGSRTCSFPLVSDSRPVERRNILLNIPNVLTAAGLYP